MSNLISKRLHKTINDLQQKVNYLKALLHYSADIIVAGDTQGRITEFNNTAERFFGYNKKEVLGKSIEVLYFYPYDRKKLMELLQKKGQVIDYEIRVKDKVGRLFDLSTSMAYLRNQQGRIIGTIGIAKDIRRRKLLQKQLAKTAITDGLTQLYNRGYFNIRINQAVATATDQRQVLNLIMIDLDGFKEYNDTYGHLKGDEVLQQVGSIALRNIRLKIDSAYRYGGDEFTILVPKQNPKAVQRTAEKIRQSIKQKFAPHIKASIGIAKLQPGQGIYEFIKSADEAMYKAKSLGGNRLWITK